MASQGSPPPLPQRTSPPVAKSGEQDPNVAKLYGVGGACAALALGIALSSFKMFIGLLLGVALAVVGGYGALYYLLNIAEAKVVEERKEEVKKKGEQPQLETNPLPGADMSGFFQVLGPSAQKPTTVWSWGDLKSAMLFYQDLKGHSKGVISLTNARMTVIKTKAGRIWKSTNYIRLVNPDRALLGEYRECVLFFRNGKEMEDWYLALKVATQLHVPSAAASQSTRRQHFTNLMRTVGYEWQMASIPSVPRPASVSSLPSEISKPLHVAASTPSLASTGPSGRPASLDDDFRLITDSKSGDSSKWFNLLAHRVFYFLNDDPGFVGLVKKKIAAKLAKLKKPSMLKSLTLKNITFGTKLPIASNIAIRSADPCGALRLDADIAYHGNATVELDLVVEVEILGKKIASFPVSIKVVIKSVIGKVQLAFSAPPSDLMWMGFYTEPHIDLELSSTIGEKHRLVNIPQLTDIIVSKLRQEIVEMMLMPDMDDWPLPHLKVPKGQTRERYVQWEYQAGYTPPPTIVTEFDSSDSEDDAPGFKPKSPEPKVTLAPLPAHASNPSPAHHHPFASTFSSSQDIPVVGMKARSTSNGSSNTPSSLGTPMAASSSSKALPPLPNSQPSNTTAQAPKIPPRNNTTNSHALPTSIVPLMPLHSVSPPPAPHNTPASATPSSTAPVTPSTSAPPSVPSSTASSPIASTSNKTVAKATSQSQPELPHVPGLDRTSTAPSSAIAAAAPTTDTSKTSVTVTATKSVTAESTPTVAAASEATQNARPPRGVTRTPTPPKLEMQKLSSSLIEFDTETSDAIFGPEPGTKKPVQESEPFVIHDHLPAISKDLPATQPHELDPLLARAADTAFDHKIELSRDGAPPILSSPSSSAPHENATPIDVAPATEVSTRKENDVSSPSEPSVIVPATAVIHVEEHDSGEGNTDVKKEASAQEPKRELAKSAEPGVLVDASYDPLFHPKDSSDGSSTPGTPYLLSPPMTPVAAKPISIVSGDVDSAASAPKIAEPTPISSVSVVAALNNSLQGSESAPSIIPASSPSTVLTPTSDVPLTVVAPLEQGFGNETQAGDVKVGTNALAASQSAPELAPVKDTAHNPSSSFSKAMEVKEDKEGKDIKDDWISIFDAPSSHTPNSRPSSGKIPHRENESSPQGSEVFKTISPSSFDISELPPLPPRSRPTSEIYSVPDSPISPISPARHLSPSNSPPTSSTIDDIFAGTSEHSGFHSAMQPAPPLPPRTKKQPAKTPANPTSFPSELYAPEAPKTGAKKDKSSVATTIKSIFDQVVKKLDD